MLLLVSKALGIANARFMVRGDTYEGIENWVDGGEPPPTKKEIESEIIRQQATTIPKSTNVTEHQLTQASKTN